MPTKAIVLDKVDFESLVADLINAFVDSYEGKLESGKIDERDVKSYFASSFKRILDKEGVSEMIITLADIFVDGESTGVVEIMDGDDFVRYMMEYFGDKSLFEIIGDYLDVD
jgi:uncharacterized iron-regulated protein